MGQEKGRLACFQLSATRGASEHTESLARGAEHVLNAAEVVDLRTLFLFRKQKKADMPDHLQEAIRLVGGGYSVSKQNLHVAKLLGMSLQYIIQYPGAARSIRASRSVQLTDAMRATMLRNSCIRRVRAWAP